MKRKEGLAVNVEKIFMCMMPYKSDSKEYICVITKIEFVNEKVCSRQKEIGKTYVSRIDRAEYGIPPVSINNDKKINYNWVVIIYPI
ncbi:hypothetical protein [Lonsdalea quercina]|uniref:hypothetical protein n=1 Tax=Lonsdalea quercina TaxID=71657 RepID=UPI003975C15F